MPSKTDFLWNTVFYFNKMEPAVSNSEELTASTKKYIAIRDNFQCKGSVWYHECNSKGRTLLIHHIDHIIPRSMGGTNEHSNLQLLCTECHQAKSNMGNLIRPRLNKCCKYGRLYYIDRETGFGYEEDKTAVMLN